MQANIGLKISLFIFDHKLLLCFAEMSVFENNASKSWKLSGMHISPSVSRFFPIPGFISLLNIFQHLFSTSNGEMTHMPGKDLHTSAVEMTDYFLLIAITKQPSVWKRLALRWRMADLNHT